MNPLLSERKLQSKLELAHAGSRPRRRVGLDVADLAVASAVNTLAGSALIRIESEHGVVEYVEGIHTELCLHPLSDAEVLHNGPVRKESSRTTETVHPDVAKISHSWIGERPARVCDNVSQRREVLDERSAAGGVLEAARAQMEGTGTPVWPAHAHVFLSSAFIEAWSPRQAAAPVSGSRDLPSTDEQVLRATGISGKRLTF